MQGLAVSWFRQEEVDTQEADGCLGQAATANTLISQMPQGNGERTPHSHLYTSSSSTTGREGDETHLIIPLVVLIGKGRRRLSLRMYIRHRRQAAG